MGVHAWTCKITITDQLHNKSNQTNYVNINDKPTHSTNNGFYFIHSKKY